MIIYLSITLSCCLALPHFVTADPSWTSINGTSSLFYFDKTNRTFYSAESSCRDNGGHLATIVNTTYQDAIFKAAKENGISSYWIGLTDYYRENAFQWTSGYRVVSSVFWQSSPIAGEEHVIDCVQVTVTDGKKEIDPYKSWSVKNCAAKLASVCLKGGLPDNINPISVVKKKGTCQTGFFRMSNRCIKIITDKQKKWTDAEEDCKKSGEKGGLVSILSQEEQNILTALMFNQTVDMWIGLKLNSKSRAFEWTRNFTTTYTNWKPTEPNGGLSEVCVMMYRRNKNPGEWNDQSCADKMGYICEVELLNTPDGSKQLSNPLFPPNTNNSKCKEKEHYYNDYCYFKEKPVKSFTEAETACNSKNKLSHLVSPHNLYEVAYLNAFLDKHGIKRTLLGYQISLMKGGKADFHVTSADKIEIATEYLRGIDYTDVNGTSCLSSTRAENQHVDTVSCTFKNVSFEAVCRYPLSNASRHPDNMKYNCENDWVKSTGSRRCLKLFREKLEFKEAEKECVKNDGHLLSIHSVQEQTDASSLSEKVTGGVWIGLQLTWDKANNIQLHWIDDSPVSFYHWRVNEPTSPTAVKTENCVELRQGSDDWNNVRCLKLKSFICWKSPKKTVAISSTVATAMTTDTPTAAPDNTTTTENTSTKPTTTKKPPTKITTTVKPKKNTTKSPTHAPSIVCPKEMSLHFNSCYLVVGTVKETWEGAEKKCKKLHEDAHLASIHDMSENEVITKLVKESKDDDGVWIGLSDTYNLYDEGFSYWSDHSPISFPHFDKNQEPGVFGAGGCVVINTKGFWQTKHCTYKRNFICKYTTQKWPKPVHVPPPKGGKYCLKGFLKFRESCYKLVQKPEVFTKAIDKCKLLTDPKFKAVTNLARIDTFEDNEFLISLLKSLPGKEKIAWIGLHFFQNEFHWANNEAMQFSRWPVNMSYVDQKTACVGIGTRMMIPGESGHWYGRSCADRYPYICQTPLISTKQTTTSPCRAGYDGYYNVDGSCYFLDQKAVTFDEAKKTCDNHLLRNDNIAATTSMLTLTSIHEMSYIRAWLISRGVTDRPVWLGLNLKKGNNVWKWENGHMVNFTYSSKFPDDPSGCFYLKVQGTQYQFGMQVDPTCKALGITVCKLSPRLQVKQPRDCLLSDDGATYIGHEAKTASGQSCIRWDLVRDMHLRMKMDISMPDGSASAASNFCRYPPGIHKDMKSPFCYTTRGNSTHRPAAEACYIKHCSQPTHGYVVVVAILVIVLLVTISFFVGVMVWRRTNTAQGFIPYLRQHDPEGGTSFHNPIYTPAATC